MMNPGCNLKFIKHKMCLFEVWTTRMRQKLSNHVIEGDYETISFTIPQKRKCKTHFPFLGKYQNEKNCARHCQNDSAQVDTSNDDQRVCWIYRFERYTIRFLTQICAWGVEPPISRPCNGRAASGMLWRGVCFFGGVPREVLYGNMKTVVIERNA